MAKYITKRQQGGQQGQSIAGAIVDEMGHIWRPNTGVDAGIDGHIEIRNARTGEASNLIVQAQVKSVENKFANETEQSFEYTCDVRDLQYWLGGNCPVVLVLVRRSNREAYWINVRSYFADDARRRSRKVTVSKQRDRFDANSGQRIMDAAIPETSGLYMPALPQAEKLRANLLKVKSFGKRLFVAECLLKSPKDINDTLRPTSRHLDFDWVMKGGRLLTFHDLRQARWKSIADRGTVEDFDPLEWAQADDLQRHYQFVELLNLCLRKKLAPYRTRWYSKRKIVYFAPNEGGVSRELTYKSYKSRTARLVVSPHMRADDPTLVSYYLHHAVETQFLRLDDEWHVALNPTYHYTSDGEALYRHYDALLKGSSLFDKNASVSGQTRMWMELLLDPQGSFGRYPFLSFEAPKEFELPVGVPDDDWRGTDAEPKVEDDSTLEQVPQPKMIRRLFDA